MTSTGNTGKDIQGLSSIGIVVQLSGLTERQIRYLEKAGIVSPQRTQGGRRLYNAEQIVLLRRIKQLKDKHIGLKRIKEYLTVNVSHPPKTSDSDNHEDRNSMRRYQDAKVFFDTSIRDGKGTRFLGKGR